MPWKNMLPTRLTVAAIAYGSQTFSMTDYAKAGWICVLIVIARDIRLIASWCALLGIPFWNPNVRWSF